MQKTQIVPTTPGSVPAVRCRIPAARLLRGVIRGSIRATRPTREGIRRRIQGGIRRRIRGQTRGRLRATRRLRGRIRGRIREERGGAPAAVSEAEEDGVLTTFPVLRVPTRCHPVSISLSMSDVWISCFRLNSDDSGATESGLTRAS